MRRTLLSLAALAAVLTAPAFAEEAETDGSRRDTWYIGFGFGSGFANITLGDESKSYGELFEDIEEAAGTKFDSSVRVTVDFEAGGTVTPQLLMGVKIASIQQQASKESGGDRVELSLQHMQLLGCATYFPLPDGEGLFVRGGLGAASVTARTKLEIRGVEARGEDNETGLAGMAGFGYAFWLGDSFNLTISNDFHYAKFGGDEDKGEPTAGWFDDISLGFSWY